MTTHAPDDSDSPQAASSEDDVPALLAGSRIITTLQDASTHVASWVRNSALYRWLTAEPDPDVIVIDLRETWTVGPVLRVLDWLVERLVDAAAGSRAVGVAQRGIAASRAAPLRVVGLMAAAFGLLVAGSGLLGSVSTTRFGIGIALAVGGVIAMQDERDLATLRETRPVAFAIAMLEPPEHPDEGTSDGSDSLQRSVQHSSTHSSQDNDVDTLDSKPER